MYLVDGMPPEQEARIFNEQATNNEAKWRIRHSTDGVSVDWPSSYRTAEDALAVLGKRIDEELALPR
jgi:hypothetical protein